MKKIIVIVWISLVLISGIADSANAYTADVKYFFQGLDIDIGEVFTDPTMLLIIGGSLGDQIEEILKPPKQVFPAFEQTGDIYFEFDPTGGTSYLVFVLESLKNITNLIVGDEVTEIPDTPDGFFSVPINNHDIVQLTTYEETIEFRVELPSNIDVPIIVSTISDQPGPGPNPVIPEPSTLILLGLGLVGFLGFRRWRKSRERGIKEIKRFLFLIALVGITGVFVLGDAQPVFAQFDCSTVTEIPQIECQALVALYTSTDGDNWRANGNWLQTNTPCGWSGVTCEAGHVTGLWMSNNYLNGNLPPELGNLTNLQELTITYNAWEGYRILTGNLPAELGNLVNLQILDLQGNRLSGSLPAELGNLTNLQVLDLHSNYQLSGSLPAELGNLTNLQSLILSTNQLSGTIPPELGNLSNLESLSLGINQLSGAIPPELGNLSNLESLSLNANQLSGSIPPELGNLTNLYGLYLGNNQLSGGIPHELGNLTNLHGLELHDNQLSGSIPPEIGNLVNMLTLYLMGNQLSGSIPSEIGNLTNLATLWLHNNQLSGSLPPEIGNLTNLHDLYLYDNQLSGKLPPELGNLDLGPGYSLGYFDLSNNQFHGPLPVELTNISRLSKFYFHDTNLCVPQDAAFQSWLADIQDVQGTGVVCSGSCDNVTTIPVAECDALVNLYTSTDGDNWSDNTDWLQTNMPCSWYGVTCNAGHITEISLDSNQLNGSLPPEIGNLDNLTGFDVQNNIQLSGSLPANLTYLNVLDTLYFNSTNLCEPQDIRFQTWLSGVADVQGTGIACADFCDSVTEIPQSECQALVSLYSSTDGNNWSNNSDWLQTNMPCSWYEVTCTNGHVTRLGLYNNQLSGNLPPEIGNLTNLQILLAFNNQLNGSLPPEIGNLSNLQNLSLHSNQLSESLPPELGNLTNLSSLNLYNNQLSGSLPPELGNLSNLFELGLSNNQLSGSLPPEIGNLTNLNTLGLLNNQLSGSLPPEIGNLTNLFELGLSNNQLSGSLPPELGNLSQLSGLDLANNQLSGPLPENLTNLFLFSFYFNDTDLCEPQNAAFQSWLVSVPDVQSTGVACSSFDYFVYDEYGGTYEDVDKTPQAGDDEAMCWNFSGSNILDWAGWQDDPPLDTAEAISKNVKDYWTNAGGMMKYLWRWWMDGTPPPDLGVGWSMLTATNGGNHWGNYDFADYYYSHWHKNVIAAIKDYLHSGYGVSMRIYDSENNQNGEHALTVWGYRFYKDGTVLGVWVTDSDDATSEPPELRLLPVTYTAKWINSMLYELKWRVADDVQATPYQGWLIEGVQALKPKDPNSLRVRKAGTGTGSVVSTPSGIACGNECVSPYQPGTPVTLTATPESGSSFIGWQGACSGTGSCTVTIGGEIEVVAIFDAVPGTTPDTFTITAHPEPGVTVYSGNVDHVPAGADTTLIFAPDNDHILLDVLVDGYSVGPVSHYTFTDTITDHTIEIKTIEKDSLLAITKKKCIELDQNGDIVYENGEEKEITCTPGNNAAIYIGDQVCDSECMQMVVPFTVGTALILKAVPDGNSTFLRWEVNGEPIEPENEDRIRYTLEDIFLEPVIGCNHS